MKITKVHGVIISDQEKREGEEYAIKWIWVCNLTQNIIRFTAVCLLAQINSAEIIITTYYSYSFPLHPFRSKLLLKNKVQKISPLFFITQHCMLGKATKNLVTSFLNLLFYPFIFFFSSTCIIDIFTLIIFRASKPGHTHMHIHTQSQEKKKKRT